MRKKQTVSSILLICLIGIYSIISIIPAFFMLSGSFMSIAEAKDTYGMVYIMTADASRYAQLRLLPRIFSINQYTRILFFDPTFLYMFWNSIALVVPITLGVIIVSCLGGYGFSKFDFPLRKPLFLLYILVIMLPYQVTLVPNYLVINWLGLMGSRPAIILPAIFSPFGTFLMCQFMGGLPDEVLESARLEGANEWQVFLLISLPISRPGAASLLLLTLIDAWNMIESPLVFLRDTTQYPLSVALANFNRTDIGIAFACGVLFALPLMLIFFQNQQMLTDGIGNSVVKGGIK